MLIPHTGDEDMEVRQTKLPITPNYLAHPPFPYIKPGRTAEQLSLHTPVTSSINSEGKRVGIYKLLFLLSLISRNFSPVFACWWSS